MLVDITLWGTVDKVATSIALIKSHEPPDGYYVCFSGGKDSVVTLDLVKRAGVKFDAHYNVTTMEPPQLIDFIKQFHPNIPLHFPPSDIFALMKKNLFPPTRKIRYCTRELKLPAGMGRTKITGIRRQESAARRNRQPWEPERLTLNPIVDWSAADVWEYIHSNNLPYCKLYDLGFSRLGCVFCPFLGMRETNLHLQAFPDIAAKFKDTFNWIMAERQRLGKFGKNPKFTTGEELWNWWISQIRQPNSKKGGNSNE